MKYFIISSLMLAFTFNSAYSSEKKLSADEIADLVGLRQKGYNAMIVIENFGKLYNKKLQNFHIFNQYSANTLNKHFAHYIARGKLFRGEYKTYGNNPKTDTRFIPPVRDDLVSTTRRANMRDMETIINVIVESERQGRHSFENVNSIAYYLEKILTSMGTSHHLYNHVNVAYALAHQATKCREDEFSPMMSALVEMRQAQEQNNMGKLQRMHDHFSSMMTPEQRASFPFSNSQCHAPFSGFSTPMDRTQDLFEEKEDPSSWVTTHSYTHGNAQVTERRSQNGGVSLSFKNPNGGPVSINFDNFSMGGGKISGSAKINGQPYSW